MPVNVLLESIIERSALDGISKTDFMITKTSRCDFWRKSLKEALISTWLK